MTGCWRRGFRQAILVALLTGPIARLSAADYVGQVTFTGLALPGATITATREDQRLTTVSDQDGIFHLPNLAEGSWTIRVDMLGFASVTRDLVVAPDTPPSTFDLTLLPFDAIVRDAPVRRSSTSDTPATAAPMRPTVKSGDSPKGGMSPVAEIGTQSAAGTTGNGQTGTGFRRAPIAATAPPPTDAASPGDPGGAPGFGAADGFLINGSVNNGAASPFAQLAAFGNNRRGARSLYNGGVGIMLGNSAWDSRPFSFTGQEAAKPSYSDVQIVGTFAGPVKLPRRFRNRPSLFLTYQRTSDHNVSTQSALMPTLLERNGDFSRTVDAFGRPVQIVDPVTGGPFLNNAIPSGRISPQATSLLEG